MENEVLVVLKEIRDEVKATNSRLDQTNSRLESLEGQVESGLASVGERIDQTNSRLESLEGRVESGLTSVGERIDQTNARLESLEERVDERLETVETRLRFVEKGLKDGFSELTQKIALVAKRQLKAEMHIGAELVSISTLLKVGTAQRKADRTVLHDYEKRISALEKRRRKPRQ